MNLLQRENSVEEHCSLPLPHKAPPKPEFVRSKTTIHWQRSGNSSVWNGPPQTLDTNTHSFRHIFNVKGEKVATGASRFLPNSQPPNQCSQPPSSPTPGFRSRVRVRSLCSSCTNGFEFAISKSDGTQKHMFLSK